MYGCCAIPVEAENLENNLLRGEILTEIVIALIDTERGGVCNGSNNKFFKNNILLGNIFSCCINVRVRRFIRLVD